MIHLLHPLVLAVLSFLAGLLFALRTTPTPEPSLLLGLAAPAGALLLARAPPFPRAREAVAGLLLLAFAASGAALGSVTAAGVRADCRTVLADGARVRATGVLAARAHDAADAPLLPLSDARLAIGRDPCEGDVRIRLPAGIPVLPTGTRVEVVGEWIAARAPVVDGGWPRRPLYAGSLRVDSVLGARPASASEHPLLVLRGAADERLYRLFPRHGALAEALLLGRREWVDPALRDRFARAGLVHLLAISGAHVGLLAGMLLLLGSLLRQPRRRVVAGVLAVLALYLATIGAPASALRAGVMIALGLLASTLQRPAATFPVVAAAALVIVALDPLAILEPGAQLSFAGVAGILLGFRLARPLLSGGVARRPALRRLLDALLVSAAAFAATAPIAAHHFGMVAPVAVLASLPAAPLLGLALAGVVMATALEPLASPLAGLLADGAAAALDLLDLVARAAAAAPWGHVAAPRPRWWLWTLAGAGAALALDATGRLRRPVRAAVAIGVAAALLLAGPTLARGSRSEIEVHFLDVGQGDATAIRTPAGRWLLVDAGPRIRDHDAGQRRVLPFLRARGVRHLEALILTHPDLDHIGGAPAVLRGVRVSRVVDPGLPAGKEAYVELLRLVEELGVTWIAARSGRVLELDGVRLEVLWPDSGALDAAVEANQISAVVRLRFGEFAVLLPGDAPMAVEQRLCTRHGTGLRAQILKAGHHGSGTSTSEELLRAVEPELVVISAGRRNRYGHPAPSVLQRVHRSGIELARTDRDGTISLRAGKGGRWSHIEP